MTETATFPFDTSVAPDDAPPDGPDRRRLLLFITVGVVVSALVGYFLAVSLFGGSEATPAPAAKRTAPIPLAGGAPLASPPAAPQSVAGAANRNPFLPLVYPPAAGAAAPARAPAAPAPAAIAPGGQSPAATTPGMTTFKVLSVSGNQAVLTIDGVRYSVSVGQSFARTYKLISTSNGVCADFTNAGARVGLCEGQTLIF